MADQNNRETINIHFDDIIEEVDRLIKWKEDTYPYRVQRQNLDRRDAEKRLASMRALKIILEKMKKGTKGIKAMDCNHLVNFPFAMPKPRMYK